MALASVFALGCVLPQLAGAAGATARATGLGYSQTPSTTEPYAACPLPKPGHVQCLSIIVPPGTARSGLQFNAPGRSGANQARPSFTQSGQMVPGEEAARATHAPSEASKGVALSGFGLEGSGEYGGLAPADLRSAYRLPATGGSGQTVAIVDAFNDPNAQADLQTYREKYKLAFKGAETACTEANGCFKKVDQTDETEAEAKEHSKAFPANEPGWSEEISLDLDMASAVCPECHILLVEATNSEISNLDISENEAATLKATAISNSWGKLEESGETSEDKYFIHENASHERIPITASAGDNGYGVSYPAASKDVIAVGGTMLYKTPFYERGWSEEAWWDTGSGCSAYEVKESWQTTGCGEKGEKRVDNDVAAVASVESPVSMYDTFEVPGWLLAGGTSVSSPIVAGVEALSSAAVRAEGAATFYKHPTALFDVTKGLNWATVQEKACSPEFLCTAVTGYDGPTGNGTPDLEGGGNGGLLEKWYGVTMPGYSSQSSAVSCSSSTKCVSVGSEGRYAVSDSWNGIKWSAFRWPFARPAGTVELSVPAVSCPTETCIAVGSWTESKGYARALAEISTSGGGNWATMTVPLPESTVRSLLTSVSCTTTTACTAVGSYLVGTAYKIFAERLSGKEWSVETMPQPSNASVEGVSCSSATSCVAVGSYYNPTNFATEALTETWNGSAWATHTPTIAGAEQSALSTVSCTAATACTEAGWYETSTKERVTLVERWNGSEWSKQTFLRLKGAPFNPEIAALACASATSCEAVGWTTTAPFSFEAAATAEIWNGAGWTIQETPASESWQVRLHGLSCPSTTVCMATGSFATTEHFPYADTETNLAYSLSEGAWTAKPMSQSTSGSTSVSCAAAAECVAVGNAATSGAGEEEAVSQVWNGAAWANLAVATPPETATFGLSGIACPSLGECTTVGSYINGLGTRVSLVERSHLESYGAPKWALQASPNPSGAKASSLADVSCVSSKSCLAVGSYTNSSGTEVTLAEMWNGTEWSLQTTPNPSGAKASSLAGVSCVSSRMCVAVGSYTNGSGAEVTLAEGWNGTEWSLQTTPSPTGGYALKLSGVSCFSETGCTAVGQYNGGSRGLESLAMGWNGTAWSIQTTPYRTEWNGVSGLSSVSCSYATSCVAVGSVLVSRVETLAEFWNGTEWAIQPTTNHSEAAENVLVGVSCSASPLCMAVGYTATTKLAPIVTNLSELRAEPPVAPVVATEPATGLTKVQATLDGNVDPNGSEAKYYFEYGTTEAYGSKTAEVSAGSGASRLEESQVVTGLSAKTTYDFRIVAKSSHGTTYGANHVFVTTS